MSEFNLKDDLIKKTSIIPSNDQFNESISHITDLTFFMNSDIFFMNCLRNYINEVSSKYILFMYNNNKIHNRDDLQKYIDMLSTISLTTIEFYKRNDEQYSLLSICYFIEQLLSTMYPDYVLFNIFPSAIYSDMCTLYSAIIIEPIIMDENKKIKNEKDYINTINSIHTLLTYISEVDSEFIVLCSTILSDNWVKNYDNLSMCKDNRIDELEPDNDVNFEDFYLIRAELLKTKFNINVLDEDNLDNIYENEDDDYDNVIDNNKDINTEETKVNNKIGDLFTMPINYLYSSIFNTPHESIKKENKIPDNYIYSNSINVINNNQNKMPVSIKYTDYVSNKVYNENKKFEDVIYESINNIDNTDNNEEKDIKIYEPVYNESGYTKYIPDLVNNNIVKFIKDFSNYLNDILYTVNKNNNLEKNIIKKVIDSFHSYNFNYIDLNEIKDNYELKINIENIDLLLTILKKDAKISNIEFKKLESVTEG